jgi:hypothetical protein
MTSTVASRTDTSQDRALPPNFRLAQRCVLVVAGVHLVALALIATHADIFASSIAADYPHLNAHQMHVQTRALLLQSAIPHLVLATALLLRARALNSGRPRARMLLTVLLSVQMLAHATLPITLHQLPGYTLTILTVQAVSLAFEIAALTLLWWKPRRQ